MKNILIIGAGYAGMMAALRLSHTTRNRKDVNVTLVSGAEHFVERILLHEVAADNPPEKHRIESLIARTGVDFLQGWVTDIHPESKTVAVQTTQGATSLQYDKLVYALGSSVKKNAIPGASEYAYSIDPESAPLLQNRLKSLSAGQQVMVIGGGLTGIESATEIAESYPDLQVTLITGGEFGENLSAKGQAYLRKVFAEMNITVLENVHVTAIEKDHLVTNDATLEHDGVVVRATGFAVPELAKQSGFAVDKAGRMLVDSQLRSISYSDVYVAGDALTFGDHASLENHMTCQTAMPLGTHVGDNLAAWIRGKQEEPFAFGYVLQCISLGQKRGLAQMVNPDHSMKPTVFTGRTGSIVKRIILTYTLWSIFLERRFPAYMWAKNISTQETSVRKPVAEH